MTTKTNQWLKRLMNISLLLSCAPTAFTQDVTTPGVYAQRLQTHLPACQKDRRTQLPVPISLLQNSTRSPILWRKDWEAQAWLSESELLVMVQKDVMEKPVFLRVQTKSGHIEALDRVNAVLPDRRLDRCAVSPDGKWLLLGYQLEGDTLLMALDGSRRTLRNYQGRFRGDCYLNLHWFADSQHWFQINNAIPNGGYVLPDVSLGDRKDSGKLTPVSSRLMRQFPQWDTRAVCVVQGTLATARLPRNGIPTRQDGVWGVPERPVSHVWVTAFSLDKGKVVHRKKVFLPQRSGIVEVAFSPDGRRIVWLLEHHSQKGGVSVLHRSLWMSQGDGGKWQKVGELSTPSSHSNPSYLPGGLCWLRNGRQVSFQYKEGLYIAPIAIITPPTPSIPSPH